MLFLWDVVFGAALSKPAGRGSKGSQMRRVRRPCVISKSEDEEWLVDRLVICLERAVGHQESALRGE